MTHGTCLLRFACSVALTLIGILLSLIEWFLVSQGQKDALFMLVACIVVAWLIAPPKEYIAQTLHHIHEVAEHYKRNPP